MAFTGTRIVPLRGTFSVTVRAILSLRKGRLVLRPRERYQVCSCSSWRVIY